MREALPVIHGHKGEALQSAGLYREVKAVFAAVADGLQERKPTQALLGHASVQTTTAYARTDLGQLRGFVEQTLADTPGANDRGAIRSGRQGQER